MYKAIRSFKVKGADGNTRIVKPGDPIPEAADWPNRKAYVERNWICRADEEPGKRHYSDRVRKTPAKAVVAKPLPPAPDVEPVVDPEPVVDSEPVVEEEAPLTKKVLKGMESGELQALAESMGIDPSLSKGKTIDAILAAQ